MLRHAVFHVAPQGAILKHPAWLSRVEAFGLPSFALYAANAAEVFVLHPYNEIRSLVWRHRGEVQRLSCCRSGFATENNSTLNGSCKIVILTNISAGMNVTRRQ